LILRRVPLAPPVPGLHYIARAVLADTYTLFASEPVHHSAVELTGELTHTTGRSNVGPSPKKRQSRRPLTGDANR
jgi:hypothetical protein